jgi:copper transport protein
MQRELAALLGALAIVGAACGSSSPRAPTITAAVVIPPSPAVVDARQWGTRDVALARTGSRAVVSIVDDQGHGVDGVHVTVARRSATACGTGCYRVDGVTGTRVLVDADGHAFSFALSPSAPSGAALLRRVMRAYAQARTVTLHQRLASGPGTALVTDFAFQAPDRVRYTIRGGSQAVVVGSRRWDRASASGRWQESPQQRVAVMRLPWGRAIDIHEIARGTLTFFDLATRAWFRVTIDRRSLPRTEVMTGISHFMVNQYSRYDAPLRIAPPSG